MFIPQLPEQTGIHMISGMQQESRIGCRAESLIHHFLHNVAVVGISQVDKTERRLSLRGCTECIERSFSTGIAIADRYWNFGAGLNPLAFTFPLLHNGP